MTDYTTRRKLWIDALRSKDYNQTVHVLNDGDKSFCCLGVACDLYNKETGIGYWDERGEFVLNGSYNTEHMPYTVAEWFGFNSKDGVFNTAVITTDEDGNESNHVSLIGLNDDAEYSFEQIADFVETNPEGLWK